MEAAENLTIKSTEDFSNETDDEENGEKNTNACNWEPNMREWMMNESKTSSDTQENVYSFAGIQWGYANWKVSTYVAVIWVQ